ncbi:MAG: hypothetical protein AAGH15_26335, partial [Myxococcota bacterium]
MGSMATVCGGLGERCCPTGAFSSAFCSASGVKCSGFTGGTCEACGAPGEACCEGQACDGSGCCVDDTCVADMDLCTAAAGTCSDGACEGGACGRIGGPCCPGIGCSADFAVCRGGVCAPCGVEGEICCGAERECLAPFVCDLRPGPDICELPASVP